MTEADAATPADQRFLHPQFPRSNAYNPDWLAASAMGSNTLWMTEWLTEAMELRPGMRVLDLGCGRAVSSIFLAREFDVQVWAVDLWIKASENARRIRDAECENRIFPLHCDARSLPFAAQFFDAILCIDCFSYFGTDSLYLNYLTNFLKDDGLVGHAGAGLTRELSTVPEHLKSMWTQDFWCLHSSDWWRQLWERTGIVSIEAAGDMPDAAANWLRWQQEAHPDNTEEIDGIKADAGETLTYVRTVGRRIPDVRLVDYCWPDNLSSMDTAYEHHPILR